MQDDQVIIVSISVTSFEHTFCRISEAIISLILNMNNNIKKYTVHELTHG